jgi:hypothetical protein
VEIKRKAKKKKSGGKKLYLLNLREATTNPNGNTRKY